MEALDRLTLDLTVLLVPLIAMLLSLGLALFLKDLITNLINGLKFKLDPSFKEGDMCIIDGDKAVIVKIGLYETVFSIHNGRGHVWRYVQNERIEKIIEDTKIS